MRNINYVCNKDSLQDKFELIKEPDHTHEIDINIDLILKKFENNYNLNKKFISGRSRLLANLSSDNGCIKCGQCMSGCFYDHIYKQNFYFPKKVYF